MRAQYQQNMSDNEISHVPIIVFIFCSLVCISYRHFLCKKCLPYQSKCIIVKFLNFRCDLPKIQTKRPNFRLIHQKDANGIANSKDPDQTVLLGAVGSGSALFAQTNLS